MKNTGYRYLQLQAFQSEKQGRAFTIRRRNKGIAQLDIHFEERLLHVMNGLSTGNYQVVAQRIFAVRESADQDERIP